MRAPWDPSGTPGLTYGVVRTRRYLLPPAARRAFTRLTVWRTDPVVGSGLPSARPGLSSCRATTPGLRDRIVLATSGARCSHTRASPVAWAVRTLKLATRSAAPGPAGGRRGHRDRLEVRPVAVRGARSGPVHGLEPVVQVVRRPSGGAGGGHLGRAEGDRAAPAWQPRSTCASRPWSGRFGSPTLNEVRPVSMMNAVVCEPSCFQEKVTCPGPGPGLAVTAVTLPGRGTVTAPCAGATNPPTGMAAARPARRVFRTMCRRRCAGRARGRSAHRSSVW